MISTEDYEINNNSSPDNNNNNNKDNNKESVLNLLITSDILKNIKTNITSTSNSTSNSSSSPNNNINNNIDNNNIEIINELNDTLKNIRETIEIWRNINIIQLQNKLHEETLLIANNREEYLKRRKVLVTLIKTFINEINLTTNNLTLEEFKEKSLHLIDCFKADFDNLSTMCKKTEGVYLELYKLLREVSDPVIALSQSSVTCHHSLTTISTLENKINQLELQLQQQNQQLQSFQQQQQSQSQSQQQQPSSSLIDEYNEKLQLNIIELKTNYNNKLLQNEQIIKENIENKYLNIIKNNNLVINEKEEKINELNYMIEKINEINLKYEEENKLLIIEKENNNMLNDKINELNKKVNELTTMNNENTIKYKSKIQTLENKINSHKEVNYNEVVTSLTSFTSQLNLEYNSKNNINNNNNNNNNNTIHYLDHERAEFDIEEEIQMTTNQIIFVNNLTEFENYIKNIIKMYCKKIYKLNKNEENLKSKIDEILTENNDLKLQINKSNSEIIEHEKNIHNLKSQIETSKILLKCHNLLSNHSTETGNSKSNNDNLNENKVDKNMMLLNELVIQRENLLNKLKVKENEIKNYENKLLSFNNEINLLKEDNNKLYFKIRLLKNNYQINGIDITSSNFDENSTTDIESKYETQYFNKLENNLNLLFEKDRKQIIDHHLNVFDKYLLLFYELLLSDGWIRIVYIVYFGIVHIFALLYLSILLRPEVDSDSYEISQ